LAAALPWQPFRPSVPVTALLDVLLLAAALGTSLSACVRRFAFPFCHESARQALNATLPSLKGLAEGLVDALHTYLPRTFRRRAWDVAIDRHDVPYYGRATPQTLGGPKKHGTNRFFSYATAVVVHRGQRWCLGLIALDHADGAQAVRALAEQLHARGIRPRCLLVDRGFFSGHVILALQAAALPFVLGVPSFVAIPQLFAKPTTAVAKRRADISADTPSIGRHFTDGSALLAGGLRKAAITLRKPSDDSMT
jgi:hypothetical protein